MKFFKWLFTRWYFYPINITIFILMVSKDYGFLAINLLYYDMIQWLIFFPGMLILSFGITYTIFWLFIKFPDKLKSIEDKKIISSS